MLREGEGTLLGVAPPQLKFHCCEEPGQLVQEEPSRHRGFSGAGPSAFLFPQPVFPTGVWMGPGLPDSHRFWGTRQKHLVEGHASHKCFPGKPYLGYRESRFGTVQPRHLLLAWWLLLV